MPTKNKAEYMHLLILLAVSAVLILSNLGNIYLWQDEAQTALVAKTILTHGVPLGTDGVNSFSKDFGKECAKNGVWIWHPWFPFYLLAGFFAVFGTGNFVCRLPFALMGIAIVILAYYFARSLWHSKRAGAIAAAVLLANVPFLLLVRQCRYYSPAALFSLAGLYAYTEMLRKRRYAGVWFGASAGLLFHTHYVYCAVLLATAVIHCYVFRRERLRSVLLVAGIVSAVSLPWVILFAAMSDVVGASISWSRIVQNAGAYAVQVGRYVLPFWLLALVAAVYGWSRLRRRRPSESERLCGEPAALLAGFVVLTYAAAIFTTQESYFRYLAPLIAPCAVLIAGAFELLVGSRGRLTIVAAVLLVLLLARQMRMTDYLYEITHDYDGPIESIVEYLRENARPGDIVVVNHEDLPIKWYTDLRVIGTLTGEDPDPARRATWIVARSQQIPREEAAVNRLTDIIQWERYESESLDSDVLYQNREDPDKHLFRTPATERQMLIFHRKHQ